MVWGEVFEIRKGNGSGVKDRKLNPLKPNAAINA